MYKVVITGYVIQKEYMDTPDSWDAFDPHLMDTFIDYPDIKFIEMVELNQQGILDWRGE